MGSTTSTWVTQNATTTFLMGEITSDTLLALTTAIGIVVGIALVLAGVGYTWRKLKSKAIGRNF